ncbi:MAG: hypothetical protein HC769_01495 [Cyanobacteria bacterium CRU_2_1]|nr:hypothetical protein [Cyanobacteria bacterium RU_5_0]NJR57639.1 hypothetical protein [Cyanobacteria bacterium CRU_2_1]
MLYLAEVLRKTRVIGGGKAEFKLLACQRGELSWNAVPGEEIIPAPDDVNYTAGMLVLVDLSASKQIQRHAEASRQLVSILQNFSRLQEKAKTQEEEIEQWKQSLTYQSQELNRREMEIETRQEQLQQLEEGFENLEQQRQEIETARVEVDRLREEFERRTQELEGAWAQLRGAENRLEEQLQQATVLDEGQAYYIQDLLNRISGAVAPTESIQEQLNLTFEIISQQQNSLDNYWQHLEQQRSSTQQLQAEVDRQTQEVRDRWQTWHQSQNALIQARVELQAVQETLKLKQEFAKSLSLRLQAQESLYQQMAQLTGTSTKVDIESLEKMPLDELQNTVRDLERDLEKMSRFVQGQEEELSLQQDAIHDLQNQIQNASEYDRLRLETELADEQDRYQMLNETLVGQRRNLHERQSVLKQHQLTLARRQGYPTPENSGAADLAPLLAQLDQLRQQQTQELRTLEEQIRQLQQSVQHTQSTVEQESRKLESQWDELRQREAAAIGQIAAVAESWGRINTYQETIQPAQDSLNALRQKAEAIASVMTQFQEASDYQHQAINEMRETVQQLSSIPTHEFAAS